MPSCKIFHLNPLVIASEMSILILTYIAAEYVQTMLMLIVAHFYFITVLLRHFNMTVLIVPRQKRNPQMKQA